MRLKDTDQTAEAANRDNSACPFVSYVDFGRQTEETVRHKTKGNTPFWRNPSGKWARAAKEPHPPIDSTQNGDPHKSPPNTKKTITNIAPGVKLIECLAPIKQILPIFTEHAV